MSTRLHKELTAQAYLENAGYDTLFPRIERNRDHSESTQRIIVPMFPRYIFALADPDDLKIDIAVSRQRKLPTGIVSLIALDGTPTLVEDSFIYEIQSMLDHKETLSILPQNPFVIDDTVRFKEGSLSKTLLTVCKLESPYRVSLLLKILGRECILPNIDVKLLSKDVSLITV